MNFSQALEALKNGKRVARTGWNGRGMWIELHDPWLGAEDARVARQYIQMKDAQGMFVPWLASQTDLLANDWVLAP